MQLFKWIYTVRVARARKISCTSFVKNTFTNAFTILAPMDLSSWNYQWDRTEKISSQIYRGMLIIDFNFFTTIANISDRLKTFDLTKLSFCGQSRANIRLSIVVASTFISNCFVQLTVKRRNFSFVQNIFAYEFDGYGQTLKLSKISWTFFWLCYNVSFKRESNFLFFKRRWIPKFRKINTGNKK